MLCFAFDLVKRGSVYVTFGLANKFIKKEKGKENIWL